MLLHLGTVVKLQYAVRTLAPSARQLRLLRQTTCRPIARQPTAMR